MLDGLRPDTCVIVVDNIRWDRYMDSAMSLDLIQYGCDGENRVFLDRLTIQAEPGQVGVPAGVVNDLERSVNAALRVRAHCTCR